MRPLLSLSLAALCLAALLPRPCRADSSETGQSVDFPNLSAGTLPLRDADVAWDSGPSIPVGNDFDRLLLQGRIADGVELQACVQKGAECAWNLVELSRFSNGRFWASAPLSGRTGDVVRLRAVRGSAVAQDAVLELFSAEASGKRGEPEVAAASPPVRGSRPEEVLKAAPLKPEVIARRNWGAQPSVKPYAPTAHLRISVHHTEAAQPMSEADSRTEMRVIQQFHQKGRGWSDIGYHFLIDGSGRVWQGRPLNVMGAHILHNNEGNIGVSLMGSFHKPKNMTPTPAQLETLIALSTWLTRAYGIGASDIRGHRDQGQSNCPGDILWKMLPSIRDAVSRGGHIPNSRTGARQDPPFDPARLLGSVEAP